MSEAGTYISGTIGICRVDPTKRFPTPPTTTGPFIYIHPLRGAAATLLALGEDEVGNAKLVEEE